MSNFWLPPWYKGRGYLGGSLPPVMNLLAGTSDNFNRANGPLAGSNNWAAGTAGGSAISANEVIGTAGVQTSNFRTDGFNSNHYSIIQVGSVALVSGGYIGASVRNQDANNCYMALLFNNAGTYQIQMFKKVAGAYGSALASVNLSGAPAQGTQIVCIAEGNVIQGYVGSATGTSQSVMIVDSTFTGGSPGIEMFDANSCDNWSGGTAATGPLGAAIATDNFIRANGLVSAGQPNWSDLNATFSGVVCSGASIASNTVSAPLAQHYADFRNETYKNNQWATITKDATTPSGGPFDMGMVRWNGTDVHGYIGGSFALGNPGAQIYLLNPGGANSTLLASSGSSSSIWNTGNTFTCVANGTRISLRVNSSEVISITDATEATGQPGFMLFGVTGGNGFSAGNV